MGFVRFAILVAVAWAAVMIYRRWRQPRAAPPHSDAVARKTVRCRVCGVYLPETDAIKVGESSYCSAAHQREGKAG